MAKVPNLVPKGSRKPDTALTDNVGLDPNLTAERAAPVPAKGHRPAGSGRAKISHRQPREYPPKAQTGAGPEYRRDTPPNASTRSYPGDIIYSRTVGELLYSARKRNSFFRAKPRGKMGQKGQK